MTKHEKSKDKIQKDEASSEEDVTLPREEYEKFLARLQELEGMKDQLLRGAADFENAKKRLIKERDEFVKFSQESLIRSLLPVLDNFERALAHGGAASEGHLQKVITGIELVFKQMTEALKNQGLKRFQSLGEKFDPHRHEAIGYVENDEKADIVVEEIEAGYFLHDRLLRAAKVKVGVEKQEEIT